MQFVWVLHGAGGSLASGVFSTRDNAEAWIATHGLGGLRTRFPLDTDADNWAVEQGHLKLSRDYQTSARFIQRFSDGTVHHHYEDGACVA